LLLAGAACNVRLMFLPWMLQVIPAVKLALNYGLIKDLLTILTFGALFSLAAFASFFVHVLVAVFFPVLAGLVLGIWIYMWRNVLSHFRYL